MHPMRIADFALERYFARWEFAVDHLLCASDVQGMPMAELLALADDETRGLWDGLTLGYTESTGHPLLRREIAGLYERDRSPTTCSCSPGPRRPSSASRTCCSGPGDHAVVHVARLPEPVRGGAARAGADVTLHELHETDGWSLDVPRLLAVARRRRPGSSSSTPRTTRPGCCRRRRVGRADRRRSTSAGIHLLADEVYRFLEVDEADRLTAGADAFERGVSLGVMSKSFAMAGLRIGWLATRDRDLLARCAAVQGLHDDLLVGAVGDPRAHRVARARPRARPFARRSWRRTSTRLDGFFEDWADRFTWVRPRGGSIGFPRLTVPGRPHRRLGGRSSSRRPGVLLLPGSVFGHPGNHFRLGFGRTDLPEALAGSRRTPPGRFAERFQSAGRRVPASRSGQRAHPNAAPMAANTIESSDRQVGAAGEPDDDGRRH